jgi:hypothetical protein
MRLSMKSGHLEHNDPNPLSWGRASYPLNAGEGRRPVVVQIKIEQAVTSPELTGYMMSEQSRCTQTQRYLPLDLPKWAHYPLVSSR